MNIEIQNAIANIEAITSVEDPDELRKLEASINQLLASEHPELGANALLHVFERFPNKDGYGIFWSIVSSLESLPDYKEKLVESVRRQPSEYSLLMINRMLNAGITEVKGTNLLSLLKDVTTDKRQSEEIKKEAQGFIEWQEKKGKDAS